MRSRRSQFLSALGIALCGFVFLLVVLSAFRVPSVWFGVFLTVSIVTMSLLVGLGQAALLISGVRNRWFWIGAGILGWVLGLLVANLYDRSLRHFDIVVTTAPISGYTLPAAFLAAGMLVGSITGVAQSQVLQLPPHLAVKWISATMILYVLIWAVAGVHVWIV